MNRFARLAFYYLLVGVVFVFTFNFSPYEVEIPRFRTPILLDPEQDKLQEARENVLRDLFGESSENTPTLEGS